METLTYAYKPKPLTMLLGIVFFGLGGAFMLQQGLTNQQELVINGVFHLTVGQATAFFCVIGGLGLLFVPLGLFGVYKGLTSKARLVLGPDALTLPGAFGRPPTVIPYAEIDGLGLASVHRQVFLYVFNNGRKPSIGGSLLKDKATFETVCRELSARSGKPIE